MSVHSNRWGRVIYVTLLIKTQSNLYVLKKIVRILIYKNCMIDNLKY